MPLPEQACCLSSIPDVCRTSTGLRQTLAIQIPVEIFRCIIDHLRDDKRALAACALVCSSWLFGSRLHLHTSARIKRQPNARTFFDIITRPSNLNTLGSAIRSLSIYTSASVNPASFVTHLPALKQLYVSGAARYFRPGECLWAAEWASWFRPRAHHLTDFALGHTICESFAEFATMLPEFPALRHIALIHVDWIDPSLPTPCEPSRGQHRAIPTLPDIQSLILTGHNIHLAFYLHAHGITEIERLDLRLGKHKGDQSMMHEIQDISRCLRPLGPSVQELDLYEEFYDGTMPAVDISHHPNLRDLWFHGVDILCENPWVLEALAQVTSPRVQTLTFDAYLDNLLPSSDARNVIGGWAALQRVIAGNPRLGVLQKVQLRWLPGDNIGESDVTMIGGRILQSWKLMVRSSVQCEVVRELPKISVLEPNGAFERWFDRCPVSCSC